MDTELIAGRRVPKFDEKLRIWIERVGAQKRAGNVNLKIAIKNTDNEIYRFITCNSDGIADELDERLEKWGLQEELTTKEHAEAGIDFVYGFEPQDI